jgi:hypothetical protein
MNTGRISYSPDYKSDNHKPLPVLNKLCPKCALENECGQDPWVAVECPNFAKKSAPQR